MSVIKFVPRGPLKPLFAIKLSPTIHRLLEEFNEKDQLTYIKNSLSINPKRVVGLKTIVDHNQNPGTMIVIFDYIYEHIIPKFEIPYDENGAFLFKVYDVDFNQDINIEQLLKQL